MDPHSRQFLLSWMTVLESMPDLDVIAYLPMFLEGLFRILSDQNLEIRRMCGQCRLHFPLPFPRQPVAFRGVSYISLRPSHRVLVEACNLTLPVFTPSGARHCSVSSSARSSTTRARASRQPYRDLAIQLGSRPSTPSCPMSRHRAVWMRSNALAVAVE